MKDGGYYVWGEKSEEFQVLNLERKCAMSVYLSTVWVSGGVSYCFFSNLPHDIAGVLQG